MNLGVEWEIRPTANKSFIEGRVGDVVSDGIHIGVIGEVNPMVLGEWKLENPTAAFEINLQPVLEHTLRLQ